MARRALRRINPAIDLSGHLLVLETLAQPFDAAAVFERAAPVEIEIGSGKGLFLSAAAAGDPNGNYVGVEIVAKYASHVAARLATRELANARVVHGDGEYLLKAWIADDSVRAVHVYFPDPWWKARHRKRRVMNARFLADVQRVLVPGGLLHFWTDVEEYYRESLDLIAAHTRLSGPQAVAERAADHDLDYRTHFERRTRQAGEAVYRAQFNKPLESTIDA
jgi:tRNA (guanine-N7-)-methyltransferase